MKVELYGGSMEFTQEGNCVDGDIEAIDIQVKDGGAGKFFVIRTQRWSFDKPEEIMKLIKKVERDFIKIAQEEKNAGN